MTPPNARQQKHTDLHSAARNALTAETDASWEGYDCAESVNALMVSIKESITKERPLEAELLFDPVPFSFSESRLTGRAAAGVRRVLTGSESGLSRV